MSNHIHCHDCGLEYGGDAWIEAIIPDHVWNKIRPRENGKGGGILCISCMVKRMNILRMKDVPIWLCGCEPVVAHEGDPGDELEILRTWRK